MARGSKSSTPDQLKRLRAWLGKKAKPAFQKLESSRPATPGELRKLAEAIGAPLPESFVVYLKSANGGVPFFEYDGLSTGDIIEAHLDSKADAKRSFRARKWLPFAADGGGNLWILDLSGDAERVRRWELAGRQVSAEGVSFATFVERIVTALESGSFTYDKDSGIFDGPFVDLLARDVPIVTPNTIFIYRTSELDLDVSKFLPAGAGPRGCLFFIASDELADRLFDAIEEPELDHAKEGMKLADAVFKKAKTKSLAALQGLTSATSGFHAAKAEKVEAWLRKSGADVRPIAELLG